MTLEELILALIAGAGGAIIVKLIELWIWRSEKKESAKNIIKKNLDPILKAADDLVGKLYSLQRKDFKNLPKEGSPFPIEKEVEPSILCYYFANFWARIQILKKESIYVNLNSTDNGKYLQAFINRLESKSARLLSRALQRGIGESIIIKNDNQLDTLSFYEFHEKYCADERFRSWFEPLQSYLKDPKKGGFAQRILIHGTILNALLDTLDSKHLYAQERKAWPNKLTEKNRKIGQYLRFVKNADRFYNI
jgi:hypothetical protein